MKFNRPWLLVFVAGSLFGGIGLAQDSGSGGGGGGSSSSSAGGAGGAGADAGNTGGTGGAGGAGGGSSAFPGTGASSSFAAPASGTVPSSAATGAQGAGLAPIPSGQNNPNGASSTIPPTGPTGTEDQSTTGQGSASSFGTGQNQNGQVLQQAPTTFSIPGFYGKSGQSFTVGEGRLARPKFRFSGNISSGYDDNVFQTPNHPQAIPEQKVDVMIAPAVPAHGVQEAIPSGDPTIPAAVETVLVPAQKPVFRTVTIPGVPAQQRIESWVTRTDGKFDMQFASRRTLFTFDVGGGVDYYWNQPGQKADYNGNLSMIYLHKFSGRGQFTFQLTSSYQKQPDFSLPNTPSNNNVGDYLTTNAKADIAYRLTPRFSSTTSLSYSNLDYVQTPASNYHSTTFGTELRYLFSPRLTLLGEARYAYDTYPQQSANDTSEAILMFGGELTLSRRFSAGLRLGEEIQTYTEGGSSASSPHVEASLNYRIGAGTSVGWTAQYGYEASGSPDFRNLTARTSFNVSQVFTPRLQGTLGVNLLRTSTTSLTNPSSSTTVSTVATPNTLGLSPNSVQDTVDATIGFYYTLDRHWSLNLTYSYTMMNISPQANTDYFRQRIFLGAAYQF